MTLIVAKTYKSNLRILADTRLSHFNDEAVRRRPIDGALKIIALNPMLAVAIAGSSDLALEAIRKHGAAGALTASDLAENLYEVHCRYDGQVSFLVATMTPGASLNCIIGGELHRDVPAAWIGDKEAAEAYQKAYGQAPGVPRFEESEVREWLNISRKMDAALGAVMEDETYRTVGGLRVELESTPSGFQYKAWGEGRHHRTMLGAMGETISIPRGPEEGGFNFSVLVPQSSGIGALGIHYLQASLGALYYPMRYDGAEFFRNCSAKEFAEAVEAKYGFPMRGIAWPAPDADDQEVELIGDETLLK